MGVVAELMVLVGANTAAFDVGMRAVQKRTAEVSAEQAKAGDQAGKTGGLLSNVGVLGLGAVAGLAAFGGAAVLHSQEAGQAAFEMSEKFGLMPTQASAWLAAAQQIGIGSDTMSSGFKFLDKNAGAAGAGSKPMIKNFADLGINVRDANGHVKTANDLMSETVAAFGRLPDGVEKSALAAKLFGKSGMDLLPMLNQGAEGTKKLMEHGKALGLVQSNEQVEAAHKLYLEHKQLDATVSGLTNQFGNTLMPVLSSVLGFVLNTGIPAIAGLVKGISQLGPWMPLIAAGFALVGGALVASMIPGIISAVTTLPLMIGQMYAVAIAENAMFWPMLLIVAGIALVIAAVVLIMQHWDFLKEKTGAVWSWIKDHVTGIVTWFEGLPGRFLATAQMIGSNIMSGITGALGGLGNAILGFITAPLHLLTAIPVIGGAIGDQFRSWGIPGFDMGGIVPGVVNSPQLIWARGGEEYGGTSGLGGGRGGITVNVTVMGHVSTERDLALALREQLRRLDREQR